MARSITAMKISRHCFAAVKERPYVYASTAGVLLLSLAASTQRFFKIVIAFGEGDPSSGERAVGTTILSVASIIALLVIGIFLTSLFGLFTARKERPYADFLISGAFVLLLAASALPILKIATAFRDDYPSTADRAVGTTILSFAATFVLLVIGTFLVSLFCLFTTRKEGPFAYALISGILLLSLAASVGNILKIGLGSSIGIGDGHPPAEARAFGATILSIAATIALLVIGTFLVSLFCLFTVRTQEHNVLDRT
jgi:heme/copper-type cytochrome/quinol oxidase subunit 2